MRHRGSPTKEVLSSISRSRAAQGFSPSETAMFVFSLKQPLFEVLKRESLPAQELDGRNLAGVGLVGQAGAPHLRSLSKEP